MRFDVVRGADINFDADVGTMSRNSAICPFCNTTIPKTRIEQISCGHGLGSQLMAVVAQSVNGKVYLPPLDVFADMETDFRPNASDVPDELLPYLRSIFNCHIYGVKKWALLFSPRQLLCVTAFASGVRAAIARIVQIHDENYSAAIAAYLAIILDRLADFNTTLCAWKESAGHTFARQALGMIWDYSEVNPFSGLTGSWTSQMSQVLPVIRSCATISRTANVIRGSATKLPFESESIDAILTDPPYYDAVPYSDLSDFFYVWQKRVLGLTHKHLYSTPLTPKASEVVQLAGRNESYSLKTKEWFEQQMQLAFRACKAILKPNGIIGVMYAHKSTSAWESLIGGLLSAGVYVTASWPLNTEMSSRLRAQGAAALASSIILICRSRQSGGHGLWDDVRKELQTTARERLEFFWSQGIRGADFFISAIGPALSVFGKFDQVTKLSGEEVTVAQFMDEVRSLVTSFALSKILKSSHTGNIDPESRFYVVWKWSYGEAKVPADESFKLAQALGMDTDVMWDRTGVLEKAGENVLALSIEKRKKIRELGEKNADGSPASLIDVLHRMCVYREKSDDAGMAEFLNRSGQIQNSALWLVAQAVSEILPDGDKEKQLMQGLLNQKDKLQEAGRQSGLFA
jgi:adenine-specific DNA methylase